jgi:hypothetical protein
MAQKRHFLLLIALLIIGGCATVPNGPSVMVWPGPGKSLEAFQGDDVGCRQWASQQSGPAAETANKTMGTGAVIGTALGAALGAAIGSTTADAGVGAGIGALAGLLGGTAVAAGPASEAGATVQRRYDNAYLQCMYLRGNTPPGYVPRSKKSYPPPPPPPGMSPQTPLLPPPDIYPAPSPQ